MKTGALPSVEEPRCTVLSHEQSKVWEQHHVCAIMVTKNSTGSFDRLEKRTCGVSTERTWPNGTHRVEDCDRVQD